jgi:hypothetical protein
MVKNGLEDVVRKVIKYKQLCHQVLRVVAEKKEGPSEERKNESVS